MQWRIFVYPDILIPSCKTEYDLSDMIGEVMVNSRDNRVMYSCSPASAAINRNLCLEMAESEIVIMVDDDMTGFFLGWADLLVAPFKTRDDIIYVSARLMNEVGSPQMVMGFSKNVMSPQVEVNIAPSACIAFRNDGLRFWEEYIKSGFEDTDFHFQLKEKYGYNKKVLINNGVKLTHKHEMKGQNEAFEHNAKIFDRRWPGKRAALKL